MKLRNSEVAIWISRSFAVGVLLGVIAFVLPLVLLGTKGSAVAEPQLLPPLIVAEHTASFEPWDSLKTVRLLRGDGEVEELMMDEYLFRVVAAEMPASFEAEALKAQAVCARTYALWKMSSGKHSNAGAELCDSSACCQAYRTPEELESKWGDLAEDYGKRIAAAVAETDGQIMTYEGAPIQAAFFSSSTAATEDAVAVWGNSLPYLVSVDSPEREEVPNYYSTVVLTAEEVRCLLKDSGVEADLSGHSSDWLGEVSYTDSGRVSQMEIGGAVLSGGAARTLFGLRSTCFSVEEEEGKFTFSVVGYGHGVGMSQYGANAMAKSGSTWQDIVNHYYTGVAIGRADS